MLPFLPFLLSLSQLAEKQNHRYLVRLKGSKQWKEQLFTSFIRQKRYSEVIKLGGSSIEGSSNLTYRQGSSLLGKECDCIFYDSVNGFDGNSLAAASGCLKGGGLFFFHFVESDNNSSRWIADHLENGITLDQAQPCPELPYADNSKQQWVKSEGERSYDEQNCAIAQIHNVVSGHSKRPLVITADRGRGKSSALGIASAQLMMQKDMVIAVTAPARKSVSPLFEHARLNLANAELVEQNTIQWKQSQLIYVAADELLSGEVCCDLLLIDEASAIPITMLKALVSRYPRVVISTTIHGYEGCGRGFTLKFYPWLQDNRPGWKHYHINEAIRWNKNDPLEEWIFKLFLLNHDLDTDKAVLTSSDSRSFSLVDKNELLQSSELFSRCFSLLVNAHYQTSPNDLLQILDDPSLHLYTLRCKESVLGCLVVKQEGDIEGELANAIVAGSRRPKGHLAPSLIASQYGLKEALYEPCVRIMRIAVSPLLQNSGIGTSMLDELFTRNDFAASYFATSYGVSSDLLHFWQKSDFMPVRLGSSYDKASGTHSLLMVKQVKTMPWLDTALSYFSRNLLSLLADSFTSLDTSLIKSMLASDNVTAHKLSSSELQLLSLYASGGSSYESVLFLLSDFVEQQLFSANDRLSNLLISKVLQKRTWSDCARLYGYSGRKQTERELRQHIQLLLEFTL